VVAVLVVILAGVGIGFLGLLESDMYFVGTVVLFIGLVGFAVRLGDALRWLRRWWPD